MRYSTRKGLLIVFAFAALVLISGWVALLGVHSSASAAVRGVGSAPTQSLVPADGTEPLPPGAVIETLLEDMDQPVAMAFDPAGRLFYTEKETGQVRLFENETLQAAPVITFGVNTDGERGLIGIAIDPQFSANHYIYVYYSCDELHGCPASENRVVRFVESGGTGINPTTIFTSTQTASIHAGGAIHFGPDGKLYISIGDNYEADEAQDVTTTHGKMHRINSDGTIPPDNPVFTQTAALPSLYAIGLRNSFDFTFDPLNPGGLFASENGPYCDDELNRIVGGYDYGWRGAYPCDDETGPDPEFNTIPPMWFLPNGDCCDAPTGITVYTGTRIPQWTNHLFMASYNSGSLRHFYLDGSRTVVTATNAIDGVLSNTALANGPDGALWYIERGGYSWGALKRITNTGPTVTPTSTATATATPPPTPHLIGHVVWEGAPAQPHPRQQQPITLTLKLGATEVDYPPVNTDASGFFTVSVAGLAPGSYNWRVKGPKSLAKSGSLNLVAPNTTNADFGLMRTGDANDSNGVNSVDFSVLRSTFGTPNDLRADFNNDGIVNVGDFSLLRANFGLVGDAPI